MSEQQTVHCANCGRPIKVVPWMSGLGWGHEPNGDSDCRIHAAPAERDTTAAEAELDRWREMGYR